MSGPLNLFRDYQKFASKAKTPQPGPIIARFMDAQLFTVPINGRILDNGGDALDSELHLPFPKIIIELESEIDDKYNMTNIADGMDAMSFVTNVYNRHIVFAEEVDGEIHVQSASKFRMDGEYPNMWNTVPFKMKLKRNIQHDGAFEASIIPTHIQAFEGIDLEKHGTTPSDIGLTMLRPAFKVVAELLEALACSNVKAEQKPNKKRLAGRRPGELPYSDYHELVVYASKSSGSHEATGESGIKRREHLRRGHIRTYQSGLKIWVQAHVVNAGAKGRIEKSYKVKK